MKPRIRPALILFVLALAALAAGLLLHFRKNSTAPRPLLVHCAAGLRLPVEEIAAKFTAETGIPVQLQYGGSNQLLASLTAAQRGDLYIPADDSYLALAREKSLTAETIPLATMHAVLAVKKGNPRRLFILGDLRNGVKLGQANPDTAAIGKLTKESLTAAREWDAIHAATTIYKPTVNEIANDLKLGTIEAAILWDAVAAQYPEFETIQLQQLKSATAKIAVAVLTTSQQPTAALRFARYLAASDRGAPIFQKHHYQSTGGDAWVLQPSINLYAGAMLRPAIEHTLAAFQQREGVKIATIYNGCGILVGQMKAGERPDAYFACDATFMTQVKDLFLDSATVSTNRLVIVVKKGNPFAIKTLADLGKPGIRLGIGHEQQCAMGALTRTTLDVDGTYAAVSKNVVVQSPTGDLLVNQLLTGSLDAAIAYISNAAGNADKLDAIAIDLPCATAAQPIATGRESKFPQLVARLTAAIQTAESRAQFEANGFQWGLKTTAPTQK